jgi:DNA-binding GntR family transcriptional regulator
VFARLADCIGSIQQAFERHEHQTVRELTTMFYEQMFHGGGKKVAWEIVQTLNARINRLRAMTIASDDRGRQAVQEMNRILDALRARDAQRARDAATAHVARVADIAAELLRQTVGEASALSHSTPHTATHIPNLEIAAVQIQKTPHFPT